MQLILHERDAIVNGAEYGFEVKLYKLAAFSIPSNRKATISSVKCQSYDHVSILTASVMEWLECSPRMR